ncbi:hypothetical protein F5972_10855 [Microbispora cellulosiformans]|uniref:Uncharacterized protein n=1 Tax=Microbispora cellulosiformans TaxID=2614688 RepID=A0A5J5K8V4_9ACTN|nr:hypothetical protein [Microbispora cellulosiformans]KAA9380094.1 hypothetical protein F5972_10855 [Microbispora cellulosiformans]
MEAPVMQAVEVLVPGVSTVTRYIRYYALYAALAAHAAERDLDREACRRLLRRSEVIFAGTHLGIPAETPPGPAHGIDRVRAFNGERLDVAHSASEGQTSYSPRPWGFWAQYGGPSTVLGTVVLENGALRPGRHPCPPEVRELFEPLFTHAEADSMSARDLVELGDLALSSEHRPEVPWLRDLFTASRMNLHDPDHWEPDDRTRRATLRVLARSVELHGTDGGSFEGMLRSAVAFGDQIDRDPVLSSIEQSQGWRGVLLRHYSVGAWRRLWATLVASMGGEDGEADRTREELRTWLADQVEDVSVTKALDGLQPLQDGSGHPYPRERQLLDGDRRAPLTNIKLLLVGGMRARELSGIAQKTFLGPRRRGMGEILDPTWVHLLTEEYRGRSLKDLAARLADDMLAQAMRVARAKMRIDPVTQRLRLFSRVHERNDRFYKTSDEGDSDVGTRIEQLGGFAAQLGLLQASDNGWGVTDEARTALELTA